MEHKSIPLALLSAILVVVLFSNTAGANWTSEPTPAPLISSGSYKWLGASTNYSKNQGVYVGIYVTNPSVPHNETTSSFFYAWAMIYSSNRSKWVQVGWSEVSWKSDAQYVTEYDTQHNQWYFYTQYKLTVGLSYYFAITYSGSGSWATWIWWNSTWKLLTRANIGLSVAEVTGQFCEVYSATNNWFYVPNTMISGAYLLINNQWSLWNTKYLTSQYSYSPPYYVYYTSRYYYWYLYKR